MKRITKFITVIALVLGLGATFVPAMAGAVNVFDQCSNAANADSAVCKSTNDKADNLIKNIVNIMIYFIGIVSVIVIIISGFIYATSSGEAAQVTKAKNTLTYAIAGLVIALVAYAVVNWIIDRLS